MLHLFEINGITPTHEDMESAARACVAGGQVRRAVRVLDDMTALLLKPSSTLYCQVISAMAAAVSPMLINTYRRAAAAHEELATERRVAGGAAFDVRAVPAAVGRAAIVSALYEMCAGERDLPGSAGLVIRVASVSTGRTGLILIRVPASLHVPVAVSQTLTAPWTPMRVWSSCPVGLLL